MVPSGRWKKQITSLLPSPSTSWMDTEQGRSGWAPPAAVPPENVPVERKGAQKTGLELTFGIAAVDQQVGAAVSREIAQPYIPSVTQVPTPEFGARR